MNHLLGSNWCMFSAKWKVNSIICDTQTDRPHTSIQYYYNAGSVSGCWLTPIDETKTGAAWPKCVSMQLHPAEDAAGDSDVTCRWPRALCTAAVWGLHTHCLKADARKHHKQCRCEKIQAGGEGLCGKIVTLLHWVVNDDGVGLFSREILYNVPLKYFH